MATNRSESGGIKIKTISAPSIEHWNHYLPMWRNGRRTRFRCVRGNSWGFESLHRQIFYKNYICDNIVLLKTKYMSTWHSAGGFLQERSRGLSKPSELVKRKCSVWRIFYQSKIWWTEEHRAANNPREMIMYRFSRGEVYADTWKSNIDVDVAESVYAHVWGACGETRAGSSPAVDIKKGITYVIPFLIYEWWGL